MFKIATFWDIDPHVSILSMPLMNGWITSLPSTQVDVVVYHRFLLYRNTHQENTLRTFGGPKNELHFKRRFRLELINLVIKEISKKWDPRKIIMDYFRSELIFLLPLLLERWPFVWPNICHRKVWKFKTSF